MMSASACFQNSELLFDRLCFLSIGSIGEVGLNKVLYLPEGVYSSRIAECSKGGILQYFWPSL